MSSLSCSDSHVSGTPPSSPTDIPAFDNIEECIDCTLPSPNWTPNPSNAKHSTPPPPQNTNNHQHSLSSQALLAASVPLPTTPTATQNEQTQQHSSSAQALLGSSVPHNTKRSNINALKALASFCITNFRQHWSFLLRQNDMSQALREARCFIFPTKEGDHLPSGYTDWTDAQLQNVRYYLVEFVANYKNSRTGEDFAPSTLKTYILSIQRAFKQEWGYDLKLLSGPVFNSATDGLFSVLDNKAREQQRSGKHVISHNVLSKDDLRKLYSSRSLSKDTPKGFQTRLVFTIGILTAMRPSALATLSVTQFKKTKIREKVVWIISGAVGSVTGASKTARGGWAAIGNKVQEIPVWDEDYEDGSINFYKDIDEYMCIRSNLEVGTERFFLAVNPHALRRQDFFKRQHMGKNSFMATVKTACTNEGIQGEGQKNWVTTHGLRGTLATLLFQKGHSDSSVALRTGHRDPKSLKSYQNLQGVGGIQQQRDLFGVDEKHAKRVKVSGGEDSDKENGSVVQRGTAASRNPFANIGNVTGGTVNVTVHCHVYPEKE